MGHLVTLATCNLNQFVLDYEGNTRRIIESIKIAKAKGAKLRVGPELEICGYGVLDHLLEQDLYLHCWEMMEKILRDDSCGNILLDIGMPVQHRNVRYNCRMICLNGRILAIRPKLFLANNGNYREMRHFATWARPREFDEYSLPRRIQKLKGQSHVPFGDVVIATKDSVIGMESCEELFTLRSPHIDQFLDGVEIISNSSASHFTLRKLDVRLKLISEATRKNGGVYLYANQLGCAGDRLLFDGCAMCVVNGEIVAQGSQFSLNEVEVVTATVDLEEVRAYRSAISSAFQAATSKAKYHRIQTNFSLSSDEKEDFDIARRPNLPFEPRYHPPMEEIAFSAGCYLWDYLRRTGAAGFLVPLSGGIDSCATAVLVFSMCRLVIQAVKEGNKQVIADVKRIAKFKAEIPQTPEELCNQIFHTVYMGMSKQSSKETRGRARELAGAIGSFHVNLDIDDIYNAQKALIMKNLDFEPKFKVEGGSEAENLMLQNIQARSRMVTAYSFAQIMPTTRQRPGGGSLLVLASANVGESLCGYLTKYDASSADINPIGTLDKRDLKAMIAWARDNYGLDILDEFLLAQPTAELEPITETYTQSDEVDMGMTYDEISIMGRLRMNHRLGPYGMFERLLHDWNKDRPQVTGDDAPRYDARGIAEKVKRFYSKYFLNRHKMTTLTPSLHCNDYSPDDNRHDLRPIFAIRAWDSWAFKKIDEHVERIEALVGNKQ